MQQQRPQMIGRGTTQYSQRKLTRASQEEKKSEQTTLENYTLIPPITKVEEEPRLFRFGDDDDEVVTRDKHRGIVAGGTRKRSRSLGSGSSDNETIKLEGHQTKPIQDDSKSAWAASGNNMTSARQAYSGMYQPPSRTWQYDDDSYGKASDIFNNIKADASQRSSQIEDEENTPYLRGDSDGLSSSALELKSMTLEQAAGKQREYGGRRYAQTVSSMHDHFTHEADESAQKYTAQQSRNFPKEFYRDLNQEGVRDLGSVLSSDHNRRLGGTINTAQSNSTSGSYNWNHDRARGRMHDLSQINDDAFAMADRREQEQKKNQINISVMHGSVEEIEADKKRKQRLTGSSYAGATTTTMQSSRKLADVTKNSKEVNQSTVSKSGVLNSAQSEELTRTLEARQYEIEASRYTSTGIGPSSSSSITQYQSKFGKEYMLKQKQDAQDRRSYKIDNHVSRDSAHQKVQRQLREREERKKAKEAAAQLDAVQRAGRQAADTDMHKSWSVGDGFGNMASSLFTEQGRQEAEQRRLANLESDQEEDEAADITAKYDLRSQREAQDFQRQMEIINSVTDTVHPRKIDALARSAQQNDALQKNMFLTQLNIQGDGKDGSDEDPFERGRGVVGSSLRYGTGPASFHSTRAGLDQLERQQTAPIYSKTSASYLGHPACRVGQLPGSRQAMWAQNMVNMRDANIPIGKFDIDNHMSSPYNQVRDNGAGSTAQNRQKSKANDQPDLYFYESQSKYISLKKFSEELFEYRDFQQMSTSIYNKNYRGNTSQLSLMEWFENLLNHERAIALTVLDPDLVRLVKQMHQMTMEYGFGLFDKKPESHVGLRAPDGGRYEPVGDFNLHFKKGGYMPPSRRTDSYDYYGLEKHKPPKFHHDQLTERERSRRTAEDMILSQLRIIRVNDEEALTLSNYLLENADFLKQSMRTIEPGWLSGELKPQELPLQQVSDASVIMQGQSKAPTTKSKELPSRKKKDQPNEQNFFTLNVRQVAAPSTGTYRERAGMFRNQGAKSQQQSELSDTHVLPDTSDLSLGQMICHVLEKCLNIQYLDFKQKLKNPMQKFFFNKNETSGSFTNTFYWNDLKLAKFWMDLAPAQKEDFWTRVGNIEEDALKQIKESEAFRKGQFNFEDIKEKDDEFDDANGNDSGSYGRSRHQKTRADSARSNRIDDAGFGLLYSDQNDSSSDEHERKWDNKMKSRLGADHLQNKFKEWTTGDADEDIERGRRQHDPTSQGYVLLSQGGEDDDDVVVKTKKRGPILTRSGKGIHALDEDLEYSNSEERRRRRMRSSQAYEDDDDRTETDHSIDKPPAQQRRKDDSKDGGLSSGKRGTVFQRFKGASNLTSQPGDEDDDSKNPNTDYENDEFEDASKDDLVTHILGDDEDIDDDDDFHLPKKHKQNLASATPSQPNQSISELKKQMLAKKAQKEQAVKMEAQSQPQLVETGVGVKATDLPAAEPAAKKKNKKKKKKPKKTDAEEEEKAAGADPAQSGSKPSLAKVLEQQRNTQLSNCYNKELAALRHAAQNLQSVALPKEDAQQQMIAEYDNAISENFLFIRSISTCNGLPTTQSSQYIDGELQTMSLPEIIKYKLCGFLYQLLHDDFQQALERSLQEQQTPDTSQAAASENQTKKKKKKNKKKQPAAEETLVEADAVELATALVESIDESIKQKDSQPSETIANAEGATEGAAQTQQEKKKSKKKQKRNKKKADREENEEESKAQESALRPDEHRQDRRDETSPTQIKSTSNRIVPQEELKQSERIAAQREPADEQRSGAAKNRDESRRSSRNYINSLSRRNGDPDIDESPVMRSTDEAIKRNNLENKKRLQALQDTNLIPMSQPKVYKPESVAEEEKDGDAASMLEVVSQSDVSSDLRHKKALLENLQQEHKMLCRNEQEIAMAEYKKRILDLDDSVGSVPSFLNNWSDQDKEEKKQLEMLNSDFATDAEVAEEVEEEQKKLSSFKNWEEERRGLLSSQVHADKYTDDGITGFGAGLSPDNRASHFSDKHRRQADPYPSPMQATQNLAQALGIHSARRPLLASLKQSVDDDQDVEKQLAQRVQEMELRQISNDIENSQDWEKFMGKEAVASGHRQEEKRLQRLKEQYGEDYREGVRRRHPEEISAAKRQNDALGRGLVIRENDDLLGSLDELINESKMPEELIKKDLPSSMVMTDLKDERLAQEKANKFDSNRRNLAAADQAIDLAAEELGAEDASEDGQKPKTKNKKRQKKNKKKKKTAATAEEEGGAAADKVEELKNSIIPEQDQVEESGVEEWQRELQSVLKEQKDEDSDEFPADRRSNQVNCSEGGDEAYFDDNWYENEIDRPGRSDSPIKHPRPPPRMPPATDIIDMDDIQIEFDQAKEAEVKTSTTVPIVSVEKCKQNYKAKKEKQEAAEKTETTMVEEIDVTDQIETMTKEEIIVQPAQTAAAPQSKKKSKSEKKKEAKQNQKEKKKQLKQQADELKEKKEQMKKEMLERKMLKKKEEQEGEQQEKTGDVAADDDEVENEDTGAAEHLQSMALMQSSTQRQKELELPRLDELDTTTGRVHSKRADKSEPATKRNFKDFQRDSSGSQSRPPLRAGSSRGASQSSGGQQKDPILDELDGLFAKVYNKPQEATTRSINDSLNNSKKNSPQSSTQKDAPATSLTAIDGRLDAKKLTNALAAEQLKNQRGQSIEAISSGSKSQKQKGTLDSKIPTSRKSPSPGERRGVVNELHVAPASIENMASKKKKKAEAAAKKNEQKQSKAKKTVKQSNSPAPQVPEILRAEPPSKTPPVPQQKKKDKQQNTQATTQKKKKREEDKKDDKKEAGPVTLANNKNFDTQQTNLEQIKPESSKDPQFHHVNLSAQLFPQQQQATSQNQMSMPNAMAAQDQQQMFNQQQQAAAQQQFMQQQMNLMNQQSQPAIPQQRLQEILSAGAEFPQASQLGMMSGQPMNANNQQLLDNLQLQQQVQQQMQRMLQPQINIEYFRVTVQNGQQQQQANPTSGQSDADRLALPSSHDDTGVNTQQQQQRPFMQANFGQMTINGGMGQPNAQNVQAYQQLLASLQQQSSMMMQNANAANAGYMPQFQFPQQFMPQHQFNQQAQVPQQQITSPPMFMNPPQMSNTGNQSSPQQQDHFQMNNLKSMQAAAAAAAAKNFQQFNPQQLWPSADHPQHMMFQQNQNQQQQPFFVPQQNQNEHQMQQMMNNFYPQQSATQQQAAQQQQFYNYSQQLYQMHQAQQTQKMLILRELRQQGYVLNNAEFEMLNKQCTAQELQHVREFYEVLDSQILKLQADQELKLQRTQKLRERSFRIISDSIKSVYRRKKPGLAEQVKIEMYGSMATGLAIDSSDLDILVHDFVDQDSPRFQQMSRQQLIEEMQMLHEALMKVYALTQNTLIETASVPVIKLKIDLIKLCKKERERDAQFEVDPSDLLLDEETQELSIDITLDEPKRSLKSDGTSVAMNEHLGLQCCKYIQSRVAEYPKMKILALVFKKFLSLKNLNKPFLGGLSSYSLVQMLVALLKSHEEQIGYLEYLDRVGASSAQLPSLSLSVGMIFKSFIHEYGFGFNAQDRGISADGRFASRQHFNYLLHAPDCNINAPIVIPGSDGNPTSQFPEGLCTCGQGPETPKHDRENKTFEHLIQQLLTGQPAHEAEENEALQERLAASRKRGPDVKLIIVDPLNRFNNIGKSSYNFAAIQEEFRDVYRRLQEELIRFVKFVAARPPQESSNSFQQLGGSGMSGSPDKMSSLIDSGNRSQIEEADMIDGLIPRILQIDYKMSRPSEEVKQQQQIEEKKQLPTVKPKAKGAQMASRQATNTASGTLTTPSKKDVKVNEERKASDKQKNENPAGLGNNQKQGKKNKKQMAS